MFFCQNIETYPSSGQFVVRCFAAYILKYKKAADKIRRRFKILFFKFFRKAFDYAFSGDYSAENASSVNNRNKVLV